MVEVDREYFQVVTMNNPLKQGLKRFPKQSCEQNVNIVTMNNPLKQGLKHIGFCPMSFYVLVTMNNPLKQGLKQSVRMLCIPYNTN